MDFIHIPIGRFWTTWPVLAGKLDVFSWYTVAPHKIEALLDRKKWNGYW